MGGDLLHDAAGPDTFWTNRNTAEALPGVMYPLSWGFWREPLELAMRGAFSDMGVLRRRDVVFHERPDDRFSASFFGRFTANVDKMRSVGAAMPGTSADAVEEQILGGKRDGVETPNAAGRYPVVAAKMPVALIRTPKLVHAARAANGAWWAQVTSRAATEELEGAPARLAQARERFGAAMRPHSVATMLAQAMYDQLHKLAETAGRPGLETTLATGYGGMEEVQLAADLWEVSRGRLGMDEFLARHGYHGPNEGALQARSWREDQTPLARLIETYQAMGEDEGPRDLERRRAAEREAAEAELLAALPRSRRRGAKLVLRIARRHIPLREVGKAAFLQAIDGGRAAARSHGRWLVAHGALDDPADVFFLTIAEVEERRAEDLRELVAERRAERERYVELTIPDTWTGSPEPIAAVAAAEERPAEIEGMAVAPGIVEGRARVVEDPEAGIDLDDGEILVCRTTDPSWASYFLAAGAVVIDIGGPMSHGAIVAREMGIPCVINTKIGTAAISSGDLLRVDGGEGRVSVLERAAAVS